MVKRKALNGIDLANLAANFSREHESPLRSIEASIREVNKLEMDVQQRTTELLMVIADTHIENSASLPGRLGELVRRRSDAEKNVRDELSLVEASIGKKTELVGQLSRAIDDIQVQAQDAVDASAELQELEDEINQLKAQDAALRPDEDEILDEVKTKLEAYRESPIYNYLVKLDFQTAPGSGLTRALNQWLAGLCNFQVNMANQQMLSTMADTIKTRRPAREESIAIKQLVLEKRQTEIFNAAIRKYANEWRAANNNESLAGKHPLPEALEQARKQLSSEKRKANELHGQLAEFSDKTDRWYKEYSASIVESLQGKSTSELTKETLLTSSERDDEALREIVQLKEIVADLGLQRAQLESSKQGALERYEKAKSAERMLNSAQFQKARATYSERINPTDLLTAYMVGAIVLEEVAERLLAAQTIEKPVRLPQIDYGSGGTGGTSRESSSGSDPYPWGWSSSSSSGSTSSTRDSDSGSSGGFSTSSSFGGSDSSSSDSSYSTSDSF